MIGRQSRRLVHWLDRAVLGAVMGVAAFVIERAIVRSTRRVAAAPARTVTFSDPAG